jgi:hypothetical protein
VSLVFDEMHGTKWPVIRSSCAREDYVLQLTGDKNKSMGVFVSAVHQFCGLAFRKSKSWMILKARS